MGYLLTDASLTLPDNLPLYQDDAMKRAAGQVLLDFNDSNCNPNSVRPSNFVAGAAFTNLIVGGPAATVIGTTLRNADVTIDAGNGLLVPTTTSGVDLGGNNYDVYNKAFIRLLWFKQKTGHPTTATQGMTHRSNGSSAVGSMQHAMFMAAGGDNLTVIVGNATAIVSYNMGVTALDTVTQAGYAYDPATGILKAIKNGLVVASVTLPGGGNLAQPSGTALDRIGNGYGANFNGFVYRLYQEDLSASGADPADVAALDYAAIIGRFT